MSGIHFTRFFLPLQTWLCAVPQSGALPCGTLSVWEGQGSCACAAGAELHGHGSVCLMETSGLLPWLQGPLAAASPGCHSCCSTTGLAATPTPPWSCLHMRGVDSVTQAGPFLPQWGRWAQDGVCSTQVPRVRTENQTLGKPSTSASKPTRGPSRCRGPHAGADGHFSWER